MTIATSAMGEVHSHTEARPCTYKYRYTFDKRGVGDWDSGWGSRRVQSLRNAIRAIDTAYMCVYIYIYIYIYVCVCVCVCVYIYIYMCVCVCVCVCISIYLYVCKYI